MAKIQRRPAVDIGQIIKQFFLSGFVIVSFVAYAVQQRFSQSDSRISAAAPTAVAQSMASDGSSVATAAPSGRYKDGVYKGPQVDAYYGMVSIEATVQHGKIVDVQFLQYPNDRRTSVYINSIAMPYLQQEAIQAQSANVDLISGATLTSEAFMLSLNSALQSAKN